MATGADIPPELFRRILFDVCDGAHLLLDLSKIVPNRKEVIKNITACSLTCVYWAHICRQQLFQRVSIKNYEDMRAFRSLVVNTPTRFAPISEYVDPVTLVQRVGDRPWLHLVQMQPSLFRFWRLRNSEPVYYFHIEDSPNNACNVQRSMFQRLFASLPRTLPSSCLQCDTLTIDKLHFVTPHDLTSLLQRFSFSGYGTLRLTNVAWSAQADFARDLLARDPLLISPFSDLNVEVYRSAYTAETAWLAFSTIFHRLSTQASISTDNVISATDSEFLKEWKRRPTLQVLSSAQRFIVGICKSVCKVSSLNYTNFFMSPIARAHTDIPPKDIRAYGICNTRIHAYEAAGDKLLSNIELVFYGTQAMIPVTNVSDPIVVMVDSISVLCAHIASTEGLIKPGRPSNVALPTHPPYSWAEIVGLCAAQPGFMRLQLEFDSLDHLVRFMEAQRAAFGKLDGRIALFFWNEEKSSHKRCAADFETLADLGDAYEHGYINPLY